MKYSLFFSCIIVTTMSNAQISIQEQINKLKQKTEKIISGNKLQENKTTNIPVGNVEAAKYVNELVEAATQHFTGWYGSLLNAKTGKYAASKCFPGATACYACKSYTSDANSYIVYGSDQQNEKDNHFYIALMGSSLDANAANKIFDDMYAQLSKMNFVWGTSIEDGYPDSEHTRFANWRVDGLSPNFERYKNIIVELRSSFPKGSWDGNDYIVTLLVYDQYRSH